MADDFHVIEEAWWLYAVSVEIAQPVLHCGIGLHALQRRDLVCDLLVRREMLDEAKCSENNLIVGGAQKSVNEFADNLFVVREEVSRELILYFLAIASSESYLFNLFVFAEAVHHLLLAKEAILLANLYLHGGDPIKVADLAS